MTLSRRQLERTDLIVEVEQGRRVEGELFAENHRNLQTMGELFKARVFGSTEYAIGLRKRMTNYVQGGGVAQPGRAAAGLVSRGPDANSEPSQIVAGSIPAPVSPEPYPDPRPEHGVLCDCDPCHEAVKRLLRDCGVLPKKADLRDLTAEAVVGRLKVPTRYRKDESDR